MQRSKKGIMGLGLLAAVMSISPWERARFSAYAADEKAVGQQLDGIQNPHFSATTPPKAGEDPLSEEVVSQLNNRWEKEKARLLQPNCKRGVSFVLVKDKESTVTVMAFKNEHLPVKGVFKNVAGSWTWNKAEQFGDGEGAVLLSSYDSGVMERDRRVQKNILEVSEPDKGIALIKIKRFEIEGGAKVINEFFKKGSAKRRLFSGKVEMEVNLNGAMHGLTMGVNMTKMRGGDIHMVSNPAHLKFASDRLKPKILMMMEQCQHQFLSSHVELTVDFHWKRVCH